MAHEAPPAVDPAHSMRWTVLKWVAGIVLMLTVGFFLGVGREVPPGPDGEAE
jgi:hypothetical protein